MAKMQKKSLILILRMTLTSMTLFTFRQRRSASLTPIVICQFQEFDGWVGENPRKVLRFTTANHFQNT